MSFSSVLIKSYQILKYFLLNQNCRTQRKDFDQKISDECPVCIVIEYSSFYSQNQSLPIREFEKIERKLEKRSINPIIGFDQKDMK